MNETAGFIAEGEARRQVQMLARRLAMLHRHYAATIERRLGPETGRKVIAEAIANYGAEVGLEHRARVQAAGYEPKVENYKKVYDVPPLFSDAERAKHEGLPACPMAQYWREVGAERVGRLYCYVDQAKYAAFDPECECRHLQNVLDGDPECETVARRREDW